MFSDRLGTAQGECILSMHQTLAVTPDNTKGRGGDQHRLHKGCVTIKRKRVLTYVLWGLVRCGGRAHA